MPDDHPHYSVCEDDLCPRFPCRVYREGWRAGYGRGWDDGFAEGYEKGFVDGLASCPGPHTGG